MTAAQDRFEKLIREQARTADERSAAGGGLKGSEERSERAGESLRRMADEFRTKMPQEQLEALEHMSDDQMRAIATLGRWMAGWLDEEGE